MNAGLGNGTEVALEIILARLPAIVLARAPCDFQFAPLLLPSSLSPQTPIPSDTRHADPLRNCSLKLSQSAVGFVQYATHLRTTDPVVHVSRARHQQVLHITLSYPTSCRLTCLNTSHKTTTPEPSKAISHNLCHPPSRDKPKLSFRFTLPLPIGIRLRILQSA